MSEARSRPEGGIVPDHEREVDEPQPDDTTDAEAEVLADIEPDDDASAAAGDVPEAAEEAALRLRDPGA